MIAERAVVALVKVEGDTMEAVDAAFADLAARVHWTLPKRRFGAVRILDKRVQLRSVSIRGAVGKAPA